MTWNFYAEADREAHYLNQAGFTTGPCGCARCELAAEIDAEIEHAAWHFDNEATVAEIDAAAAEMFASAEVRRAEEFAPSPWGDLPDPPF